MGTSRYEQDGTRILSTAGRGETFAAIMARRLSRRGLVKGGVAAGALVVAGPLDGGAPVLARALPRRQGDSLSFEPIDQTAGETTVVAAGYTAIPFLAWGDPLTPDAMGLGPFDPAGMTAAEQAKRVGYNHDFVGFLPLPLGGESSDHGLLVVNHEYTNPELMFPGYLVSNPAFATPVAAGATPTPEFIPAPTQEQVDVQLEAHGISVVEVRRTAAGAWEVVTDSPLNRRLTGTTEMTLTGPAAGNVMLQTGDDATGATVLGTLNNCAGGLTPWGTFVSCEENFHQYFGNLAKLAEDDPTRPLHERMAIPPETSERQWEKFVDRFDVANEPHEPLRHGWSVEIQHPGEGGTFEKPLSHWPEAAGPPRPALVVIQAENGGPIGSA